ncbi:delta-60 repeat domain-containing protein [Streptomyces sp. NPDC052301]|uniref:delta-60 repeat domain-containing protein n=1 Tax=Streptomyces sp. NPDC052301 TaxID=3365687 RepID=UPI0037D49D11
MYLGGDFETADGRPRKYAAAFTRTGKLLPFQAAVEGSVHALLAAPDQGKLLVGGEFGEVNGVTDNALAALDPRTGATVSRIPGGFRWTPTCSRRPATAPPCVRAPRVTTPAASTDGSPAG